MLNDRFRSPLHAGHFESDWMMVVSLTHQQREAVQIAMIVPTCSVYRPRDVVVNL